MDKFSYTIEKLSNFRFFYKQAQGPLWNFSREISLVDEFLWQCPQLQRADPYSYLYFNSFPFSPEDNESCGETYYAGRGVIGFLNLEDHDSFSIQDFFQGVCFSFPLTKLPSSQDLGFLKQKAARFLLEKGMALGPIWRLRFCLIQSETGPYSLKVDLNFYLKNDLSFPLFQREKNEIPLNKG